jgi:molecular chaperone DnaJ
MVFSRRCVSCGGSGKQRPRPCEACGGTGQETRAEHVRVRIRPGVADGDRLRVEGKGNAGVRGGPTGDLYLDVRVTPDPRFRREGANLHLSVPVAVHEAALGARIDVPAPDGTARLTIPPGTQSGRQLKVRERGMPTGRDGQRGDLVVEVRLMLPEVLDERSRELLREFGRINGERVRDRVFEPVKESVETTVAGAADAPASDGNAAMAGRRDGEAR